MRASLSHWLKSVDSFGHPVQVNYKGDKTFKSQVGGVLSLLSMALTLMMVVRAVKEMVLMEEPTLSEFAKPLELSDRIELAPVKFSDYDFIFMIITFVESDAY